MAVIQLSASNTQLIERSLDGADLICDVKYPFDACLMAALCWQITNSTQCKCIIVYNCICTKSTVKLSSPTEERNIF